MIYFAAEFSEPKSINAGIIDTKCNLFVFTFLSSILSASFGMAKLLQAGPCRMVKLDSYGLGFLLIFLSSLSGLMARGLNLGVMVTGFNGIQDTMHEYSESLLKFEKILNITQQLSVEYPVLADMKTSEIEKIVSGSESMKIK